MLEWAKKVFLKINTPDGIAMSVGLLGFVLLTAGIALVSVAAALIVAGVLLMAWSAMFSRAIANSRGGA